ncbi:hypothetical protein ABEX44_22750 [Priestia megaterium]
MAKRKTYEEFVEELRELVNDEYIVYKKEEYKNASTKLHIRHNKCGNVYLVSPSTFLRGSRCPKCQHRSTKKTTQEFKQDVYNLVKGEYTVLGEYETNSTKIEMIHNSCGHTYLVKPNKFLTGRRCPNCSRDALTGKLRKPHDAFLKEMYDLVADEYTVCDGEVYKSNKTKIKIRHNKCNSVYGVNPKNFIKGQRCPVCYGNKKRTTEEFIKEVRNQVGEEYEVLGNYINTMTKIKMRHDVCDHVYPVTPMNFLKGSRCPKCSDRNNSKGIKIIKRYLEINNIDYKIEEKFEGCIDKELLAFDVFIPDYNLVIEYDGEGHFEPFKFIENVEGRLKNLQNQQRRDQIKNNYCKEQNISLIRIPYWELKNLEYILDHVLGYFKVISKDDVNKEMVYKFLVNHSDWLYEKYRFEAPCNKVDSHDIQSI